MLPQTRIIRPKKSNKPAGVAPAVLLDNPKYAHNVGAALRACSCFGIEQLWWSGERAAMEIEKGKRIPREERMKGYKDVKLFNTDYPFDEFKGCVPVAVEVRPNSEPLTQFIHPERALYVFGPEDGSIRDTYLRFCHRFVVIPTRHCTNLAAAVYITLYDRHLKMASGDGNLISPGAWEARGLDTNAVPFLTDRG